MVTGVRGQGGRTVLLHVGLVHTRGPESVLILHQNMVGYSVKVKTPKLKIVLTKNVQVGAILHLYLF